MGTTNVNVALPDSVWVFVEEQVTRGGYSTAGEYLRALIEDAQKRQAKHELQALLLEGLEGEGTEVTEEYWEQFRARLKERHANRADGP